MTASTWLKTACNLCYINCGVEVWVDGGRLVVRCKVDDAMRNGQLVLPHGYRQACPTSDGERLVNGPRINLLTKSGNRDPIAGSPYHKNVAVRLAMVPAHEAAAYQSQSERIHMRAAGQ